MTEAAPTIKLGLVGVGKIARDQHFPAIASDPRFELVATASLHGVIDHVPAHETIEQMLAAGHELDAVSICTPPAGRAAIALAAMDAGLDVMVEKPPAANPAEMETLERRAHVAGAVLFTAWHSREASGVEAAREWLERRKIKQVTIRWLEDIRRWHPGQDWILGPGGFGVFDPGINALSIATAILPDPIIVKSAALNIPAGRQSPLAANVQMRCGDALVSAEFDFLHEGPQRWDIIVDTDAGQLRLREGGRILEVDGDVDEGKDQEYARLYSRFASLIEARQSDVDIAPLRLVADAFILASRQTAPEFNW
jgi:D-galactose 1-dehydrogenase/L-arabinose 1- dehydrogenase